MGVLSGYLRVRIDGLSAEGVGGLTISASGSVERKPNGDGDPSAQRD